MNKCLITKLSDSISDNYFQELDTIKGIVPNGINRLSQYITSDKNVTVTMLNGAKVSASSQGELKDSINIIRNTSSPFYITSTVDNGAIKITPKNGILQYVSNTFYGNLDEFESCYNLTDLELLATNRVKCTGYLSSLKNLTNLTKLSLVENDLILGSFKDINNLNLETLNIQRCTLIAANSSFDDIKNVSTLTSLNVNYTDIRGNIEELSNMVNLSTLQIYSTPNIYGEVTTLLDNLYANGRKSGTIRINYGAKYNNVTYKGQPYNTALTFTFTYDGWVE